jgi:hypothetical protein
VIRVGSRRVALFGLELGPELEPVLGLDLLLADILDGKKEGVVVVAGASEVVVVGGGAAIVLNADFRASSLIMNRFSMCM